MVYTIQLSILLTTVVSVLSSPQFPARSYGLPTSSRFLQDFPAPVVVQRRPPVQQTFTPHSQVFTRPQAVRGFPGDGLELLPPLQHVVGTKFPAVDPGPGFRFPVSQLLNPTPPPNIH